MMMRLIVLAALAAAQNQAAPAFDVASISVSPPTLVCELDMNQLKGELRRLSWSPDGRNLHLQTADGTVKHDYIVTVLDGVLSRAFGEPEWAAEYWAMKVDLAAPGLPALRIDVQQNNRRTRPTPFTSNAAGGAYTPDTKNPVDAIESEVTLRLFGEELGNWVNDVPLAGETYGWGPAGSATIAFVGRGGRLTLMDQERRRKVIATAKGVAWPAWSNDGARLAYLQQTGKKKYRLMTAAVGRATI
jgi:hypothetical protein